jgi:hypothetical protein
VAFGVYNENSKRDPFPMQYSDYIELKEKELMLIYTVKKVFISEYRI